MFKTQVGEGNRFAWYSLIFSCHTEVRQISLNVLRRYTCQSTCEREFLKSELNHFHWKSSTIVTGGKNLLTLRAAQKEKNGGSAREEKADEEIKYMELGEISWAIK